MNEKNQLSMHPLADARSIVQGNCYRFTVLTDRMVRMEYSPKGEFVDQATQVILNRDFPVPKFTVKERNAALKHRKMQSINIRLAAPTTEEIESDT